MTGPPHDGVLYAATHSGLFRLPEGGDPERVANRYQDTMGFTVTGPNTFLGSDIRTSPQIPTLQRASGAPPVAVLGWASQDSIFGVTADGRGFTTRYAD
ncbi:MAG: hypothetical protein WKF47_12385 [Geodermatophilaceae bacterium]